MDPTVYIRLPWKYAVLGRISYNVHTNLHFDVNAIGVIDEPGALIFPQLEWTVADLVKTQIGYVYMWGKNDKGVFGTFAHNSQVTLSLEMQF